MVDPAVELAEAANALAALIEKSASQAGKYYYEEIEVKRWVLGHGGKSGNCEICNDNADRGWVDMDDVFDSVFGDVDDAPAHPHCTCWVEFQTKRKRVYV